MGGRKVEERRKEECAIEARSCLLWLHNTTGSQVVKATPNLRSKGLGDKSMVPGRPNGLST
jgi:hypothetical protein